MRVPDAYTIGRKVGFFLKRLEAPVESLVEFAAFIRCFLPDAGT
jgi:hypothetical protein